MASASRSSATRGSQVLQLSPQDALFVGFKVDGGLRHQIEALEGPVGLTECAVHPGECAQEPSCGVREPWQRINSVVRSALTRVTLADLAQPPRGGCRTADTLALSSMGAD